MKKSIIGIPLLFFIHVLSSCQKAEPEIYLIPYSFKGKVQIIFNQNGTPVNYKNEYERDTIYNPRLGAPVKYENDKRVYEIPLSGIFLTQFKINDGFIDRKYFLVDSTGKRTSLEVFTLEHYKPDSTRWIVKDKNKKGIFLDGTSGSYGNQHIAYQEFIVSNYNELDSFYSKKYQDDFDDKIEKITGLTLYLK